MKEKTSPSPNQMAAILDNAPVAVYVSAVDNWELLYHNRLAKKLMLHKSPRKISTCYQEAGFDQPCPFCQVKKMDRDEFLVREFCRPSNGRVYQLSGKIIDWDGRPAHIEYIVDITDRKKEENSSRALREELQAIFSSIPCGLAVYQYDGEKITPLFHNPAFYEIMGYSEENIRHLERETSYLGVHPEDLPLLQKKVHHIIQQEGIIRNTHRVYNDRKNQYCWIHLQGAVKSQPDGKKLLYCVYSDVSEQQRLRQELTAANEKMQDIVNAIPGGIVIYRVADSLETMYFSDGVPELCGYTVEEYQELTRAHAAEMIYPADIDMVLKKLRKPVYTHTTSDFEFRHLHRDGHIVWVRAQAKHIGEEDGAPLLQCVFHNISDLKETQLEMDHLMNSIPGGIASYKIEGTRFNSSFYSDGVPALSGHTREEYKELLRRGLENNIYAPDRLRLREAGAAALQNGGVLDIFYRIHHKNGSLVWIRLNGRRIGPPSDSMRFYAVFTGMSAQTQLYQNIVNETANGIYVIDRENYDLLYANEPDGLFKPGANYLGRKCYAALFGKSAPCSFCTLKTHPPDGIDHVMAVDRPGRSYTTRFKETEWNNIPAYLKYVQDVTEEVNTRLEKERLEMYFQTLIENLPGGISVIRCQSDGSMTPEFISEGLAAMTHMTVDEIYNLYKEDVFAGVHPDDVAINQEKLLNYMKKGENHCELTARMKRGDGGYIWVKDTISLLHTTDGCRRLYSVYTDITKSVVEKEQLRHQYEESLLQHYRSPGPDTLILGHCNVTKNKILEIWDSTNSELIKNFGNIREDFFTGIASLILDKKEQQAFLNTYLNVPALAAYQRNETEQVLKCFIQLPTEVNGRYARFKVNLLEDPDTGDITGILTVTDITEQTISDQILHQLSVTSHDYVVNLNLARDCYTLLTCKKDVIFAPPAQGCYSDQLKYMLKFAVVPKDRKQYAHALDANEIRRRLAEKESYTFTYSVAPETGNLRTKTLTVSAVDLRLGRVCLVCTDVTAMLEAERKSQKALEHALVLAEEANRAKSDFLSAMSHDIRTPMNAIMGMTELAANHLENQERMKDCLQKISISSKHLLSLINDILDMSKIEQGKITLSQSVTSISELLEMLSAMMMPQADGKGVRLNIHTKSVIHSYFYGDSLRIGQILINLLSNAIKFTPHNGTVDFLAEEITPVLDTWQRYRFTISDTGIGMSAKFLSHIFEPFARAGNRTVERIEGTGLGLSITKGLVDLMGGKISVESQPGKGSIFQVELECRAAQEKIQKQVSLKSSAAADGKLFDGRTFLIAEDNAINAEILCELLARDGAKTVVKTDGLLAIQAFRDAEPNTYDAILMDIQMPNMNGYDAARAIRKLNHADAKIVPILALTANAFAEDIQAALDAGMNAHVAKPVDLALLKATLSKALGL